MKVDLLLLIRPIPPSLSVSSFLNGVLQGQDEFPSIGSLTHIQSSLETFPQSQPHPEICSVSSRKHTSI